MAEFVHRRVSPTLSVDQEEEMCHKLIQLSFAKIVNSKHERGGAKLHKNLLILHLLQKARTEHRRSGDSSPTEMDLHDVIEASEDTGSSEDSDDIDFEPDDDDENTGPIILSTDVPEFISEEVTITVPSEDDNDIFSTDSENSRPSLLRFVSVDEENDGVSVEISSSDFRGNNGILESALSGTRADEILGEIYHDQEEEPEEEHLSQPRVVHPEPSDVSGGLYDNHDSENCRPDSTLTELVPTQGIPEKSPTFTIISAKTKKSTSTDSGCSSGSSSPTSSEEDEEESGDSDDSLTSSPSPRARTPTSPTRRRRKRKHRSPSFAESDDGSGETTKKTCVEMDNAQLSGLISVFRNTGFLGRSDNHYSLTNMNNNLSFENSEAPEDQAEDSGPICLTSPASNADKVTCGALSVPPRSMSCPSFVELTCTS